MKTDFKVYKRKIYVYALVDGIYQFCYATNAYKTCKSAIETAQKSMPGMKLKANFAK